ncbi:MAG TPA: hypothetical protein VGH44_00200 [Candidatus Saccharimonadia bacterium]
MGITRKIGLLAVITLALGVAAPAWASLSQGFATSQNIPAGSLVSLDNKNSGAVVVADTDNVNRLFGVVVPPSSASISLSGTGSGQVQVVTSGTASVLVSTAGGTIHVGDYITVSPIAGVGEKAGGTSTRVVGTAQADFDGSGDGTTKTTVDTGSGKTEVSIGQIPVVISVSSYTASEGKQSYVVPNWLQNLSNTLAGKAVSPIRIIIAGLILIAALTSISVLLYAAVRNSIISIGRNPLSNGSVLKGLMEVIAIAVGILAVSGGAMYMVIAR